MRFSELIRETVEENQIINLIADNVAKQIMSAVLNKKLDKLPKDAKDYNIPYTKSPYLQKVLSTLEIKVSTADIGDTKGSYLLDANTIILYLPAIINSAKINQTSNLYSLKSTIVHELQHALDDAKSAGKFYKTGKYAANATPEEEWLTYARLPHEVNARLQQAFLEISDKMPKLDISQSSDLMPLINHAFKKYDLDNIYKPGDARYKQLLKRTYKFFQSELNNPKTVEPKSIVKRAISWVLGKPTSQIK